MRSVGKTRVSGSRRTCLSFIGIKVALALESGTGLSDQHCIADAGCPTPM
jgi:hypothetical protein